MYKTKNVFEMDHDELLAESVRTENAYENEPVYFHSEHLAIYLGLIRVLMTARTRKLNNADSYSAYMACAEHLNSQLPKEMQCQS